MNDIRPLEAILDVEEFFSELEAQIVERPSPAAPAETMARPAGSAEPMAHPAGLAEPMAIPSAPAPRPARRGGAVVRPPALPFWPILLWGRPDRESQPDRAEQALLSEVRGAYALIVITLGVDVVVWLSFLAILFGVSSISSGWDPGVAALPGFMNVGIVSIGLLAPLTFALFELGFFRSPSMPRRTGRPFHAVLRNVLLAVSLGVTLYLALAGRTFVAVGATIVTVGILVGALTVGFGEKTGWVMTTRIVLIVASALATAVPLDIRFAWRSVLDRYVDAESEKVRERLDDVQQTLGKAVRGIEELPDPSAGPRAPAHESSVTAAGSSLHADIGETETVRYLARCIGTECRLAVATDHKKWKDELDLWTEREKEAIECTFEYQRSGRKCSIAWEKDIGVPTVDPFAILQRATGKKNHALGRLKSVTEADESCSTRITKCAQSPRYLALLAEGQALRESAKTPPRCGPDATASYRRLAARAAADVQSHAAGAAGVDEVARDLISRIEARASTECVAAPDAFDIFAAYFALTAEDADSNDKSPSLADFGVHTRPRQGEATVPRELLHLIALFLALIGPLIVVLNKVTARRALQAYLLTGESDTALSGIFLGDLEPEARREALLLMAARGALSAEQAEWLAAVARGGMSDPDLARIAETLRDVQPLVTSPGAAGDDGGTV